MHFSLLRLSPATPVWGFRRIRNVVANGPTTGLSMFLGTRQLTAEIR